MAFVAENELGRDAVVGDGTRHKVAQDGGGVRGIKDQVRKVSQQEIKCYKEKKLRLRDQYKTCFGVSPFPISRWEMTF